ncbi:16S rRNA (guanine(966)-N(2))-methyltransferase RsmD [Bacillus piscicola]|uniref:16S rRNA (guanine(966)-N(2))-methyltransferase RsmD n=1 Tax=Bacillus piscicola TaxID=1632684 RepID=UPI001F08BECC|nr:16S rRNA (guanine(966)-N(2))-methyltransferase RsmD [Bacillus piscicola]
MRVISGRFKGRPLKAVPGMKTRPTSDKVKEALFNKIGPYFDGGTALDLYAGTGSLGIEAVSRGFSTCVFVDRAQQAVRVIKNNLSSLDLLGMCEVYRNEAERALHVLAKRKRMFDVIFLDPPYADENVTDVIELIVEMGLLAESGQIICEHRSSVDLPGSVTTLHKKQAVTYGDTGISIYKSD